MKPPYLRGYQGNLGPFYLVFMTGSAWHYRAIEQPNKPLTRITSQTYGEAWWHPLDESDASLVFITNYSPLLHDFWTRTRYTMRVPALQTTYLGPEVVYSSYQTQIGLAATHIPLGSNENHEAEISIGMASARRTPDSGPYVSVAVVRHF